MNWSTEKDLRLFIFKSLFLDPKKKAQEKTAKELVTLYEELAGKLRFAFWLPKIFQPRPTVLAT